MLRAVPLNVGRTSGRANELHSEIYRGRFSRTLFRADLTSLQSHSSYSLPRPSGRSVPGTDASLGCAALSRTVRTPRPVEERGPLVSPVTTCAVERRSAPSLRKVRESLR